MTDDNGFFPLDEVSDDLSPLPIVHRQGLIAIAVLAFLSFVSSTALLLYLTFKFVRWHLKARKQVCEDADGPSSSTVDLSLGLAQQHFMGEEPKPRGTPTRKAHPNQFLVLLYNLLLADIHQAASFLLNAVWVGRDGIYVRTPTCWAQAWLIQLGDVASSLFIAAIALHTYLAVVWNYTLPQWVVYVAVVLLWGFNYLLAVLGIAITKDGRDVGGFFVRASAWCWINVRYENLRLFLHYLWIFIAIAVTGILYALVFLSLRKRSSAKAPSLQPPTPTSSRTNIHSPNPAPFSSSITKAPSHTTTPAEATTTDRPEPLQTHAARAGHGGHHNAFLLYPLIYIVCTAPLALGRVATMAGVNVPISYFCTAGALITSNGWLDVLLWSVTRHRLLFGGDVDAPDSGLETFAFMRTPHSRRWGNMVWVEGGGDSSSGISPGGNANGKGVGRIGEGSRVAGWFRRRMGWRPLGLGGAGARVGNGAGGSAGGGGGGGRRRRAAAQGQVEGGSRGEDGLAIQMDMVTTVVVETAGDAQGRPWDRGKRIAHAASGSGGSGAREYDTDSVTEEGLGKGVK